MMYRLLGMGAIVLALAACETKPGGAPVSAPIATAKSRAELVQFQIVGRVQKIDDGDTVELRTASGGKAIIRMSDMDTPEINHGPTRPGQPMGKQAGASLAELLPLNTEVKAECYERDMYERNVCHVFRGPLNANLEQIKRGWGMTPRNDGWIRDPASRPAEATARTARIGVWAQAKPIHPDDWRRDCWNDQKCPGGI